MKTLFVLIALALSVSFASAQAPTRLCFSTNGDNCQPVDAGNPFPVTAPLSSGAATAANQTTEIGLLQTLVNQAITACNAAPIVSASAEGSHVLKATPGSVCGAYAVNLTATPGFLVLLNSTTVPGDGAITPLACVPLPAQGNGVASINFGLGASSTYGTGITAVVTSATTCFTKTTGVITAFIAGQVL